MRSGVNFSGSWEGVMCMNYEARMEDMKSYKKRKEVDWKSY